MLRTNMLRSAACTWHAACQTHVLCCANVPSAPRVAVLLALQCLVPSAHMLRLFPQEAVYDTFNTYVEISCTVIALATESAVLCCRVVSCDKFSTHVVVSCMYEHSATLTHKLKLVALLGRPQEAATGAFNTHVEISCIVIALPTESAVLCCRLASCNICSTHVQISFNKVCPTTCMHMSKGYISEASSRGSS